MKHKVLIIEKVQDDAIVEITNFDIVFKRRNNIYITIKNKVEKEFKELDELEIQKYKDPSSYLLKVIGK